MFSSVNFSYLLTTDEMLKELIGCIYWIILVSASKNYRNLIRWVSLATKNDKSVYKSWMQRTEIKFPNGPNWLDYVVAPDDRSRARLNVFKLIDSGKHPRICTSLMTYLCQNRRMCSTYCSNYILERVWLYCHNVNISLQCICDLGN